MNDFLDRRAEVEKLWWLVERNSVLMLAPRRVGKTSLLFRLIDQPKVGWHCFFCNVEPATTEAEFVARLLAKVLERESPGSWARLKPRLRELIGELDSIKLGPVEITQRIGSRWQEVGAALVHSIAKLEDKSLLLIDEFPIFASQLLQEPNGIQRTEQFMSWFRSIRNDPDLPYGAVRFILTGSIGLDAVVKRVGITNTINDLEPFTLKPLTPELADELLRRLAEGEGVVLEPALRSRALSKLSGLIPYHIQLYFRVLIDQVIFEKREISPSSIDEAYTTLLSGERRLHFEHWRERLNHPSAEPAIRDLKYAILEAAAKDPHGVALDSIRQMRAKHAQGESEDFVLQSLEHDGYLVRNGDRWRFASLLLRDWWSKWVSKTPI